MTELSIDGNAFEAYSIATPNTSVLLINAGGGFLGCGYFSIETADKVGDAIAVVSGVKSFDDMLDAPVKACSAAAARRGIAPGMSGRDALLKLV